MMPTRDEILEELNQLVENYPPRLETDVIVKDIMDKRNMSRNSASQFLHKLARQYPEKYEMLKVRNDYGGWQWALRKKT